MNFGVDSYGNKDIINNTQKLNNEKGKTMGERKKVKEMGKVVVSVYCDEKWVERVDALAAKIGVSRSQMIRNLAMVGYEDAKILDAFGVYTLIRKVEDAWRWGTSAQESSEHTA